MQKTLESASSNTIALPVEYQISKIDGERKFQIDAKSDRIDLLQGIQNLEVLQSAALITDDESSKAVVVAATPPSGHQQTATSVEAAQREQVPVPVQTTIASEVQAKHAQEPETASTSDAGQEQNSAKVIQASFDCSKAASKIETLICSTPETANADKRLSVAYADAKSKSSDQDVLKHQQRDWLTTERNACDDVACLLKVTEARIDALSAM